MMGLISALAQGLLTGRLSKKFGETWLIRASLLGSAVAFVVMIAANTTIMVYLSVAFFVISNAMLRPTVSSLTSLRAEGGQGVAMGLNNSFMSLGRIVGPIWAGSLLDINLDYPYMSGAVVMLIGFVLTLFYLGDSRPRAKMTPSRSVRIRIYWSASAENRILRGRAAWIVSDVSA